jgi:4-carboxymuconolactone decarboxylase
VIKEILYQSVPYVGVAKVFDFLHATNEVLQSKGVSLPLAGQSTTTPETRFEKGVAAQRTIFGEAIDKMRQQAPNDQLHIQDFLAANCFGDYYTRNGIDLKTRELLTFAMLISLGGCEPQVKGHVTGNLKLGNDRARLIDVVTQLLPYIGYPRTLNALRAIDEVVPAGNIAVAADTTP